MPDMQGRLFALILLLTIGFLFRRHLGHAYARFLVRRAARLLPRNVRDEYTQSWQAELHALPGVWEQISFARNLSHAACAIRDDLYPEDASRRNRLKTFVLPFVLVGGTCALLSDLGVTPAAMHLFSLTALTGLWVAMLSALTTLCLRALPEVAHVWWRFTVLLVLGLGLGLIGLSVLTTWSAFHPQTFLLMIATAWVGIRFAGAEFVPRPPRLA